MTEKIILQEKEEEFLELLFAKREYHKEQEKIRRNRKSEWQHCEIPLPHKFSEQLVDKKGKLLFLNNVFWPGQVANLHYCAHFSNGFFDCNQHAIKSEGKMLRLYCPVHEQEKQMKVNQNEQALQEFLAKQKQELADMLKAYKNS